jgi:single-strand DNA-binding protein
MSINKAILVGHVGKDPEVRYFDNGGAVASFSLATTERGYTASNGTQVPERTDWHNIVLWRGLAETAEKFIKKGSKIYVEGKIRNRSYDDANGNKRYVTEIYGDTLELLDRKPDSANKPPFPEPPAYGASASATTTPASAPAAATAATPEASAPQPSASEPAPEGNGKDDDLPF